MSKSGVHFTVTNTVNCKKYFLQRILLESSFFVEKLSIVGNH